MDPLLQARCVPLRELLLERVERRARACSPSREPGGSGRIDARTGDTLWTYRTGALTYGTPSVANGRVFVADIAGNVAALRAADGTRLWRAQVPGRVLGPTLVVGNLVFFSTLEGQTYAARVTDGRIVWHFRAGKYAPGIATEKHYYLSLNGLLAAFAGSRTPTP